MLSPHPNKSSNLFRKHLFNPPHTPNQPAQHITTPIKPHSPTQQQTIPTIHSQHHNTIHNQLVKQFDPEPQRPSIQANQFINNRQKAKRRVRGLKKTKPQRRHAIVMTGGTSQQSMRGVISVLIGSGFFWGYPVY